MSRTQNLEDMLRTLQGLEYALQEADDDGGTKKKEKTEDDDLDLSLDDEEGADKKSVKAPDIDDDALDFGDEKSEPKPKKNAPKKQPRNTDFDDLFAKADMEKDAAAPADATGVDVKDAFKVIEDAIKAGKKVNLSVDISESAGQTMISCLGDQKTRGDVPVTNRETAAVNELRKRGYKIDPPMNKSTDLSNMDPATMAILESLVTKVQELEEQLHGAQYGNLNESSGSYDAHQENTYNELMNALDEADNALSNMCSVIEMQTVAEETATGVKIVMDARAHALQEAALLEQALLIRSLDALAESVSRGVSYASLTSRAYELEELVESRMMAPEVAVGVMNALMEAELTEPMVGSNSDMTPKAYENAPEYINSTFKTPSITKSSFFDSGAGFSGTGVTFFPLPIDRHIDESKISTNSAISSLHEHLITDDGFDVVGASRAYLYQKSPNPMGIQDFAIPIAMVNENNELVAVPSLLRTAMNILANDNNLDIYKIPVDQRNMLRENLETYLVDLDITPPWRMPQ